MLLQTVSFYFATVENFNERSELLDKMELKWCKFSEEEKVAFFKTPAIGVR